jgi:LysM repeat protein
MVRDGDTVNSIAQRFGTTAQQLRELNQLGNASTIVTGAELRVPSKVSALPQVVLQAAARVDSRVLPGAVHVVRSGDTLSGIAKRHRVTVSTLTRLNNIRPTSILRIGQRLTISAANSATASAGGSGTVITSEDGQQLTYVVQRGDTLSGIARTLKVSVTSLRSWNNLPGTTILPGQRLVAFPNQGS